MASRNALFALILAAGLPAAATAQQVDMAALQRWSKARVAHYHAVGAYEGQTIIAYREDGGQATVTDRLTLDFDWDIRRKKLIGTVSIANDKSTMSDFRNVERSCPPPAPKGAYEHITASEARDLGTGTLEIKGERSYPAVDVTAYCRGSWARKSVPASKETALEHAPVPDPTMLSMPGLPSTNGVTIAADGKSFTVKAGKWTWTMTPTIVENR